MITLLGSLLGFLGAALPDILKMRRDAADRAHELAVLKMQMERQQQGHAERLEEIRAQGDTATQATIYRTWNSGVRWVDALNGTVRPILAYAFFLLYVYSKIANLYLITEGFAHSYSSFWSEEDQAIFAGIVSFYFGQRAMGKLRG